MGENINNTTRYDPTKHLFQRLRADMLACHHQMETLKILFKNFENSWLSITLDYNTDSLSSNEGVRLAPRGAHVFEYAQQSSLRLPTHCLKAKRYKIVKDELEEKCRICARGACTINLVP